MGHLTQNLGTQYEKKLFPYSQSVQGLYWNHFWTKLEFFMGGSINIVRVYLTIG